MSGLETSKTTFHPKAKAVEQPVRRNNLSYDDIYKAVLVAVYSC